MKHRGWFLGLAIFMLCAITSIPSGRLEAATVVPDKNVIKDVEKLKDMEGAASEKSGHRSKSKSRPRYDIPIEINSQVEYWIEYNTNRNRKTFTASLYRFEQYRPLMEDIFASQGVPRDLAYLALIESGGNMNAVSHSGAVGCWQFMNGTAKNYGLRVDSYVDERRDVEKATYAAATYLKNLYGIFDDWMLALAAYNAGEGSIIRLKRQNPGVKTYWDIDHRMPIKSETLSYVPKYLAALVVGKNRDRYGIRIPDGITPAYDTVMARPGVDLKEIADAADRPLNLLMKLNPELVKGCTPPGSKSYKLKVPEGTAQQVAMYLSNYKAPSTDYITHRVKSGETLYQISRDFDVAVNDLTDANRIKSDEVLEPNQVVLIPKQKQAARTNTPAPQNSSPRTAEEYIVQKGDTLMSIARARGIKLGELLAANSELPDPDHLKPQMTIKVPALADSGAVVRYEVKRGDTLWSIAKRFDVSHEDILRWNELESAAVITPGDALTIFVKKG